MDKKELTSKQINQLDVLANDKRATEKTLRIAINYCNNRMEEIIKDENEWWEEMRKIYDLDADKQYGVRFIGRATYIIEIKEKGPHE